MPLSRAAENARKKAGTSLLPKEIGTSSSDFVSLFDPKNSGSGKTLATFEPELMEYLREAPEPDTEGRENLKKRSRQNVMGRLLSSMAQLGGVASGGDATRLEDNQSPFILNKLQEMDQNEATALSQYYDEVFKTQQQNNRTTNQWRAQEAGRQFTDQQRQAGEEFRDNQRQATEQFRDEQRSKSEEFNESEARKKAKDAVNLIYSRGNVAIRKEMVDYGVDPNSKNAMEELTKRKTEEFQKEMDKPHYAPRSNYGSGSRSPIESDPDWQKTFRKGREQEISRIKQQINSIRKEPEDYNNPKETRIKELQDRLKLYEEISLNPKDQVVMDLYELGKTQQQSTQMGPPEEQQIIPQPPPTQSPYMQKKQLRNETISNIGGQIQQNSTKIADYQNWDAETASLVQQMVDQSIEAGIFKNQQEAIQGIIEGALEFSK